MILLPDTIYLNRVAENEGSIAPVEYNIYYKNIIHPIARIGMLSSGVNMV